MALRKPTGQMVQVKLSICVDRPTASVPEANYLPAHCANTFDLFDARWFDTTPVTKWWIRVRRHRKKEEKSDIGSNTFS